ncbi:MAG: putative lipoprotein involved in nitrous oxide reduction [Proteobacteria bacterium]|nr:putative lipoprotein involved in nitrous oxide reduction [Pseudomonadota bacterium]
MRRRAVLAFCLSLWVSTALAQSVPKPGTKDLCPVCGMIVAKYPNWVAVVTWKDGHSHFFDGAKDLFKFLHDLAKYAPGHRREDIAGIYVTDFYNLEIIDARRALFVAGSDVLGPMGHEFVPLASQADADDFMKDHKGRRVYGFKQIGAMLPERVDDGKFD